MASTSLLPRQILKVKAEIIVTPSYHTKHYQYINLHTTPPEPFLAIAYLGIKTAISLPHPTPLPFHTQTFGYLKKSRSAPTETESRDANEEVPSPALYTYPPALSTAFITSSTVSLSW